ncbi:unnamed protein product [marine sediment metagenome]|uniref:Uncharacterized protein n=1 Tax=marine sediment metagenome TaxID=412755 RepID=X1P182_9ZZZZ
MTEASQERALGRLESKVDLILVDNERAVHSRKEQYEKLEQITRKADLTDQKLDIIDKRLKAVEEPVAEFSKWRQRFTGMGLLIALVAGSFGALVVTLWSKLTALINH